MDIRDLRKLLAAVHERTELLKHAHAAELVSLAGGLIGVFPSALQSFAGPIMSQLPITPFNMVCTNVPGPQYPLYLFGHRMLRWYPYVPVGGEMALNCAILSYDGKVYFGFSGDVHAAPDLRRLESFLKASFVELREAVRPRRKKTAQPRRARGKTKVNEKPARTSVLLPSTRTASSPVEAGKAVKFPKEQEKVLEQLIA